MKQAARTALQFASATVALNIFLLVMGCAGSAGSGGTTTGNPLTPEDQSASGALAQAVGGALTSTSSNGKSTAFTSLAASAPQILNVLPLCPTFHSSTSEGCSASGSTLWIDYSDCSFVNSSSLWNGTQALIMSTGSATCGTFPLPGDNASLTRQYVSAPNSTSPSSVRLTSAYATTAVLDDSSANLKNFANDPITTLVNNGYGEQVSFNSSGARDSLTIARRIAVVGSYDHSLSGTASVTEVAGASTRTVNGTMTIYHNILKIIGTATLSNVLHSDQCCVPISGSITTQFDRAPSVTPTAAGAAVVGKSEELTFTGCGLATLRSYDGSTRTVSLSRCF